MVATPRSRPASSLGMLVHYVVALDAERVLDDLGGAVAVVAVDRLLKRQTGNTTEGTTLSLKREDGGKIRVASLLWEAPR
jgi:hypothetical protein